MGTSARPPGGQLDVRGGDQVGPGVPGMGVRRQRQLRVELPHGHGYDVGHDLPLPSAVRGVLPAILPGRPAVVRRTLRSVSTSPSPRRRHRASRPPGVHRAARSALVALAGRAGLGRLLAAEIWMGAAGVRAWLPFVVLLPATVAGLWWLGRIRVAVADGELRVDDARLPVRFVADVVAAGRRRPARGARASARDPLAFVVQRPWIGGAVQVRARRPGRPDAVLGGQHPPPGRAGRRRCWPPRRRRR